MLYVRVMVEWKIPVRGAYSFWACATVMLGYSYLGVVSLFTYVLYMWQSSCTPHFTYDVCAMLS